MIETLYPRIVWSDSAYRIVAMDDTVTCAERMLGHDAMGNAAWSTIAVYPANSCDGIADLALPAMLSQLRTLLSGSVLDRRGPTGYTGPWPRIVWEAEDWDDSYYSGARIVEELVPAHIVSNYNTWPWTYDDTPVPKLFLECSGDGVWKRASLSEYAPYSSHFFRHLESVPFLHHMLPLMRSACDAKRETQ